MTDILASDGIAATVVLIERDAMSVGGHWYPAALSLADTAQRHNRTIVVVTLGGIEEHAHAELTHLGAKVITRSGRTDFAARVLHRLACLAARASARSRRWCPHRRFPHQITLLARCAAEVAALRVAAAQSPNVVRVLLTASEGLPSLAGRLGGPHVRVTHDVITTQDRPLQLLVLQR